MTDELIPGILPALCSKKNISRLPGKEALTDVLNGRKSCDLFRGHQLRALKINEYVHISTCKTLLRNFRRISHPLAF